MSVTVDPEILGVYDLVEQMAVGGESDYSCDEGEAWGEGGENELGGGMLEITEVNDTCISGTFSGVAGDGSFSVPRC